MADIFEVLEGAPVVPIFAPPDIHSALSVAEALLEGGVGALEITLRTPAALDAAAALAREFPEFRLGVGTVLTEEDATAAVASGARFLVSPGATEALADSVSRLAVPWLPGVATASEVMRAAAWGLGACKLFPAVPVGGLALLDALAPVFPRMAFCPTGGIGARNYAEFLTRPNVFAVGGSWLVPGPAVADQDWAEITRRARDLKSRPDRHHG